MAGFLLVHPIILRVLHAVAARHHALWARLVVRARQRPVAESLGAVGHLPRIPVVLDDLDTHVGTPVSLIKVSLLPRALQSAARFAAS